MCALGRGGCGHFVPWEGRGSPRGFVTNATAAAIDRGWGFLHCVPWEEGLRSCCACGGAAFVL